MTFYLVIMTFYFFFYSLYLTLQGFRKIELLTMMKQTLCICLQQCTNVLFIHLDRGYTCSKHKELKTKQKDFKKTNNIKKSMTYTTPTLLKKISKCIILYMYRYLKYMYMYIICLDNFFCQTSFLIRHICIRDKYFKTPTHTHTTPLNFLHHS